MKNFLAGCIFCLIVMGVIAAVGDDLKVGTVQFPMNMKTYLNAGVGPDNNMAPIHVDKDGYVICSDEKKP